MKTAQTPLVAVIIPTRDRPELVSRAIRSALAQTHTNIEVIVFDDASSEPIRLDRDVLEDKRLRLMRSDVHVGVSQARNEAIATTSAPLIALLDDDDEWLPRKLERDLEVLDGAPARVALVHSGYELWNGDRLVYRCLPLEGRDYRCAVLREATIVPSTATMRRAAYQEIGGMDPSVSRTDDWDLWLRLLDRYDAVSVPEVHTIRTFQRIPARVILNARMRILRSIRPRIRALAAPQRLKLIAYHGAVLGAAAVRVLIGEKAWRAARWPFDAATRAALRAVGRDPTLRRW